MTELSPSFERSGAALPGLVTRNPARGLHRIVGLVTVCVFLATGWVLRLHEPPMPELDPAVRVLLRSGHIYILLAGLVNLAVGAYFTPARRRWGRGMALAGSVFVLLSPALLTAGFFLEAPGPAIDRPWTSLGLYAVFAGTLLHYLASRRSGETRP